MGKPDWILDNNRPTVVVWTAPRNDPKQVAHAVTGASNERHTLCGLTLPVGLYLSGAVATRAECNECRLILDMRKRRP